MISGLLWHGPPARLLSACLAGRAQLFLSLPLLLELEDVLEYPNFAQRLAGRGESAESVTARLRYACHEGVPAAIIPPAALRDPDDAHVLACAVGAGVDLIVSGDKDLLTLGAFQGVPIVDVAEALKRLGLS